jgi:hypothetical protein
MTKYFKSYAGLNKKAISTSHFFKIYALMFVQHELG